MYDLPRVESATCARLGVQTAPIDAVGNVRVADECAMEGLDGGYVSVMESMWVPCRRKNKSVHKRCGCIERGIGRVGKCSCVRLDGVGRVKREATASVVERRRERVGLGPSNRRHLQW